MLTDSNIGGCDNAYMCMYICIFKNNCFKKSSISIYFFFYFLLYTQEENIACAKIVDIQFLMDLHVLRCPVHDTISYTIWPFLENVCLYISKIWGHYISKTNAWKFMKLYIQLHLDIIWCWLGFGVYRCIFWCIIFFEMTNFQNEF